MELAQDLVLGISGVELLGYATTEIRNKPNFLL
jgi:hypothetical protein